MILCLYQPIGKPREQSHSRAQLFKRITSYCRVLSCICSGMPDVHRQNALLTQLRFRRVIADEFTYLEKKSLASLLRLSSCYKWVLSGTPPVSDFPAIRR
jgi:hypothetical protein